MLCCFRLCFFFTFRYSLVPRVAVLDVGFLFSFFFFCFSKGMGTIPSHAVIPIQQAESVRFTLIPVSVFFLLLAFASIPWARNCSTVLWDRLKSNQLPPCTLFLFCRVCLCIVSASIFSFCLFLSRMRLDDDYLRR